MRRLATTVCFLWFACLTISSAASAESPEPERSGLSVGVTTGYALFTSSGFRSVHTGIHNSTAFGASFASRWSAHFAATLAMPVGPSARAGTRYVAAPAGVGARLEHWWSRRVFLGGGPTWTFASRYIREESGYAYDIEFPTIGLRLRGGYAFGVWRDSALKLVVSSVAPVWDLERGRLAGEIPFTSSLAVEFQYY